ncbi:MAG: hypothetical protein KF703_03400 [Actinobacteria bacterium]|nr:hypothetical protein [Actinomycetota bacterium]
MDVYAGGVGPEAERLRTHLGGLLADRRLPHRDLEVGSGLATVWGDGTGEAVRVDAPDVEVLFDGYLHGHGAASLEDLLPDLGRRVVDRGKVLEGHESGVFNLVVLDKRTGDIHLANDPSGLLPLHHRRSPDGFAFSSHLHLAARALGTAPDPMGVACTLVLGYPLGPRTVFDGIERLNPGELVSYRAGTGTVDRSYPEVYYGDLVEPGPDLVEQIWSALVDAARPSVAAHRSIGVMLSEGFDSRLVAGVLAHLGADLRTFTHATRGTKGTRIVGEVSRALGSDHTFDYLEQGFPADLGELRAQLALADNLHVPYWDAGSRHFGATGVGATTTGYALDTTLGAHAFSSSSGSSRDRVLGRYGEILRQDLGRLGDAQMDDLAEALLVQARTPDRRWMVERIERFLDAEHAPGVVAQVDGIADEIAAEQERVRRSGSERPSQALQRYFLENRGRKFSFGQELTLRVNRPLVVPCYEPAFMRLMTSVPPRLRVHHRAYYQLLRRHLPELARIPSGAHALAPRYPRLVLETSRFAWKVHESRILRQFMATRGQTDVSRLRMVLFSEDAARRSPRLPMENLLERDSVVVNRLKMQATVDKVRDYQVRVFLPPTYLGLELTEIYDEL